MNKLIDAFRVVVEPLRFMIARNSRRIEELAQTPIEDILPSTVPVMPSAPTSSDSGKIPMVQSDGSWGLGEVPSGSGGDSGVVVVKGTMNDDGTITCNMGATQIAEKMNSGMLVFLHLYNPSTGAIQLCPTQVLTDNSHEADDRVVFETYIMDDQYGVGTNEIGLDHMAFTVLADGSVEPRGCHYQLSISDRIDMM